MLGVVGYFRTFKQKKKSIIISEVKVRYTIVLPPLFSRSKEKIAVQHVLRFDWTTELPYEVREGLLKNLLYDIYIARQFNFSDYVTDKPVKNRY